MKRIVAALIAVPAIALMAVPAQAAKVTPTVTNVTSNFTTATCTVSATAYVSGTLHGSYYMNFSGALSSGSYSGSTVADLPTGVASQQVVGSIILASGRTIQGVRASLMKGRVGGHASLVSSYLQTITYTCP